LRRLVLLASLAGFAALDLRATPPLDPICGTTSSLASVLTVRAQMQTEARARRGIRLQQIDPRPGLSIQRSTRLEYPLLILRGAAGRAHRLEATSELLSGRWTPVLSVILGNEPLTWSDESDTTVSSQFYRLRADPGEPAEEEVSNFRLLDANGVARDLYYHTHRMAIAVLAAGTNLDDVGPLVPLINELKQVHTNKVELWILLSDPAPIRSNIVSQTKNLGISVPVLLDPDGLAARSVGLTQVGEVAVIRPPAFTTVYRGEVVGPDPSAAAGSLLGQALASVTGDKPITYLRTPVQGTLLTHVTDMTPTYSKDVAPILHQYCARCHRTGGVAPFAMTNHSVIADWAPAIKHALLSGKMPPWHADPDYGHFANDLSLPGDLKSALIRWIDAGSTRGDGPDLLAEQPPPPAFDRWPDELGPPDALVTIPLQSIKATGSEPYRYLFVQAPNPTNVWLKAAIVRPSNYRVVHHYNVWRGRIGNSGSPDNSTYEPFIAYFAPGLEPLQFPPDAGMYLSRSNWLTFNLHYTTYGIETNDQPVLALWYHRATPPKTWTSFTLSNTEFSIPPGAADHQVQATWTPPKRIEIHGLNPHMHLRGKRMKYQVRYPDGTRETLLSVPDYDFNWQLGYTLAKPKIIPAGSQIILSGAFDNSPENLANPDPTLRVRWGDQSWMEMFVGVIDYTE